MFSISPRGSMLSFSMIFAALLSFSMISSPMTEALQIRVRSPEQGHRSRESTPPKDEVTGVESRESTHLAQDAVENGVSEPPPKLEELSMSWSV